MKKSFADRNFGFYILLAAAFVALAGAILYLVLDGGDRTFTILGFLLALAGAVSTILAVLTRLKFAPLVPTAFYAAASAFVLRLALPSLSDLWNKVNFIGGNAVLGTVSCFTGTEKR